MQQRPKEVVLGHRCAPMLSASSHMWLRVLLKVLDVAVCSVCHWNQVGRPSSCSVKSAEEG
jgi:hypothetical protein